MTHEYDEMLDAAAERLVGAVRWYEAMTRTAYKSQTKEQDER